MPLPWNIVLNQPGEIADTQVAYRLLMTSAELARAGLIAVDTFTRPDFAALDAAETGQAWELQGGSFAVAGLKAASAATSTVVLDVGRADVDAFCVIVPTTGAPGLVFRGGPTSADRLTVQLDMAAGFRLQKTDGGTTTPLSTAVTAFTPGQAYAVRVVAIGNSVRCYLDGAQLIDYTLTAPEQTEYGAYTRVGFRNTGAATFDNLLVRHAYPAGGGSAPTYDNLPAGSVLRSVESSGSYIRPTSRTDLTVIFIGTSNPGAAALENDLWAQTP